MSTWGIALGDTVLEGDFSIGSHDMNFASGSGIVRFPDDGMVVIPTSLKVWLYNILAKAPWLPSVPLSYLFFHNLQFLNILQDQGIEIIDPASVQGQDASASGKIKNEIPVLGFYQTTANKDNGGRLVLYGDSNCIDSAHLTKECW